MNNMNHDVSPHLVLTEDRLKEVVDFYLEQDSFAFDVETMGEDRVIPTLNRVVWISLATYGRSDVIPMGHPNGPNLLETKYPLLRAGEARRAKGLPPKPSDYSTDIRKAEYLFDDPPEQLSPSTVFQALRPLFMSPSITKVGHNLGFDLKSVTKYLGGDTPCPPYADTLIAEWVFDTSLIGRLSLDQCLMRTLGLHMEKGVGKEIEKHTFDEVARYAYLDAKWTWLLWQHLVREMNDREDIGEIFDLEMEVLAVVCDMELRGIRIDKEALLRLKGTLESDIDLARSEVYRAAGRTFNINSVSQKRELLYTSKANGGRGIKPRVLTPGGEKKKSVGQTPALEDWSVSDEALKMYEGKDELVDALSSYSDLNKMMTTYVLPYAGGSVTRTVGEKEKTEMRQSLMVRGRIHGQFVQHGTASGRFASRSPNLQNVPARTSHGKMIRRLFVPEVGNRFIVADYSQIEPRIIASLSKDVVMMETYQAGGDVYLAVAERLGVPRSTGKEMVLALAYGIGPTTISERLGITVTAAKDLMNYFAKKFPSIARHKQVVVQSAYRSRPRRSTTIYGRHRIIPELSRSSDADRSRGERIAYNHVIQGSAADINKLALVRTHSSLPQGAGIVLTVHDEIVVDCPEGLVEDVVDIVRVSMEGACDRLSVPLVADIKVVDTWGDAK